MQVVLGKRGCQTRLIVHREHFVSVGLLEGQEVECALLAAVLAVGRGGRAVCVASLADYYGQVPAAQVVLSVQDVSQT